MADRQVADTYGNEGAVHVFRGAAETLTLAQTGVHQGMYHFLDLNCFSETASKQKPFQTVHDLTELALPNVLPQCLPLPQVTVTKATWFMSLLSLTKLKASLGSAKCIFLKEHKVKGMMLLRGEMVSCKPEVEHS